jgi:ribose-phosphate pyrophosphokinase
MDLVGSVEGSDCIIVDDMIDTAGTLCQAAANLKDNGANRVFAFASHGLFSGPAADRIERSVLEEVIVVNTIPLKANAKTCEKIKQV